ncbi:MAG: mannitol-1-phosphate 5-dehydrogenase, partial [Lactococcus sp.]
GYQTILEALQNNEVLASLKDVQAETRQLLLAKWDFTEEELKAYHETIIERFSNTEIVDEISRVARTPMRKLGYDERFIRPIRELSERGLSYQSHLEVVGKIFAYKDENDKEAVVLQEALKEKGLNAVIREVTRLTDETLIAEIEASAKKYMK